MRLTARVMQQYGPYMHDRSGWNHPWLMVLFFVLVAAAIGVVIWALLRSSSHPAASHPIAHPMAAFGPPPDPAIDVLRMRFARGEIDAAEYATRVAHLTGSEPQGPGVG